MQLQNSVCGLVVERPSRARLSEKPGLDSCCGGRRSLQEACTVEGLGPKAVLERIGEHDALSTSEQPDLEGLSLAEICEAIESTHHAYPESELPRLSTRAEVAEIHGNSAARWRELLDTFQRLRSEPESHLMTEERILFPSIRRLAAAETAPPLPLGSLENPTAAMEREHDAAGAALADLRRPTDGFKPPSDACPTTLALLGSLPALEQDTPLRIHWENNTLHPKALRA
ncbi:MAG: DUF542 domain-containing protein [Fimbriimonadaceae bacterium]